MKSKIDSIGIKAVTVTVPSNIVEVRDYVNYRDSADIERIIKKTGIHSLRIALPGVTTSDLCEVSARNLFNSGWEKGSICAIVFVSKTPDYFLPPTSCVLQAKLGMDQQLLCYDTLAACYGYIGGLQLAAMIADLHKADVLLLAGDTNSKLVNREDFTSAVMFGDGGSASIVGPINDNYLHFNIKNDGNRGENAIVRAGGFRNPASVESLKIKEHERGNLRSDCHLHMNGLEMMNFVLGDAANLIAETIAEFGKDFFDIFALHQPNAMIIKSLIDCLDLPPEKVPIFVNGYGNISSASIPLGLCNNSQFLQQSRGKKIQALLSGYGGGLSWGTVVTNIASTQFLSVSEV